MTIRIANKEEEITLCFDAMKELRPHLERETFVSRIRHQQIQGYQLIFADVDGVAASAAGFRVLDYLAWGRVLYIDDLTTLPDYRGQGHGGALLDWMIARGKDQNCGELHLDSGHQRFDAHRLYLNKGMKINSHHFSIPLK